MSSRRAPHAVNLPKSGLAGSALAFANAVQAALERLTSVRLTVVDAVPDLPPASAWANRQIIVRDIDGAGTAGIATALDGAWIDHNGGAL